MNRAGAFRCDPGLKTRAVADAALCKHPGWHAAASETDRAACAEVFGVDERLINLMASAARPPFMDGSAAFLEWTLGSLEPGVDVEAAVRDWMVQVWKHPHLGVAGKLVDTAAFKPAEEIVDHVRRHDAPPLTRSDWRQVRTALLSTLTTVTPATAGFARVVAAMAWDSAATQGLASDVWTAWERASIGEVDLAHGWDQPKQDALVEIMRAAMRQAHETAEPLGEAATEEERDASDAEMKSRMEALIERAGATADLAELNRHWADNVSSFFPQWHAQAMQTITDACASAKALALS